jgi:dipeptidyl aminopeptidase/acylaminoacyl peptidase
MCAHTPFSLYFFASVLNGLALNYEGTRPSHYHKHGQRLANSDPLTHREETLASMLLAMQPNAPSFARLRPLRGGTSRVHAPQNGLTTSEAIIPREVLFGNPEYELPEISPDGKLLAYLRPDDDGVLNVWCRTTGQNNDRLVTADKYRGIRNFQWAEDSKTLLYTQDSGGDENFHLYAIDATDTSAVARDLTPFEGARAENLITNKRFPDAVLIAVNQRNPQLFDMYHCDLASGKLTMKAENPGDVMVWGSEDETFEVREAYAKIQTDSSAVVRVRDSEKDPWRDLVTFPYGEDGNMIDFAKDGKSVLALSTLGRDTTALVRLDIETGEEVQVIAENEKCDCGGILVNEDTKEVQAVSFNYARTERLFFDKAMEADYRKLEKMAPEGSEVGIVSKTRDQNTWVVSYTRDDGPKEYVIFDRTKGDTKPLFVSHPKQLDYKFARMEDVRIQASDGLELVAYLTRAKSQEATPLVLYVHGGPWARDRWSFNPTAQWLANRGYAVLQVNYRGSTGYGKTFLHKADKQWGARMQDDLSDAVKWAIQEGIALEEKVCIFGGSYGGYACLAGMTFTPDLYACGVDIVGPSNVKTLLDSIPSYWGPMRNDLLLKIGDVDADAEFNKKISPLFHVDKIRAPLLIGQGANDPRVKQAEADQIAFSMKAKDIPCEYVLYPDEGHGFGRPPNRIDFNGRTELFLEKHLGGRAEAFETVEGSTAQFPLLESN